MKINEKLKDLRLKNNMTQRELAEKLGISIPTLQKYEYGTLKIKNEVILSLCDIFDISPDDFFYEKRNDVFKETDNLLKELDKFKNTDIIKELDEIEKKEYKIVSSS